MRELEGRSYEEIGLALGANDGAVRQLLNRARGALRTAATAVLPPPLVARLATAPPDGRRVAEIVGGLGAAGVAKAGATALVAGTLVVGAINAPVPVDHGSPTRQKATLSNAGPATTIAGTTGSATRTPVTFRSIAARTGAKTRGAVRHVSPTTPAIAKHATRHSGSGQSGSGDHSGSSDPSGSGGESHSGSGNTTQSGSDEDHASRDARTPASGNPDASGSDASGDAPALSPADSPGSVSSGSGSNGSSEPDDPPAATP
jgi:hypothetical protein